MDMNSSDPILIAASQSTNSDKSADIIEVCRVFLLDFYLKHYGRVHAFDLLQREQLRLDASLSILLLIILFALTSILQSGAYPFLIGLMRRIIALARQRLGREGEPQAG